MSDEQTNPHSPPPTPPGASLLAGAARRIPEGELDDLRARVQDQLSDYELAESLGRGGMGAVFRARQINLDREVAIKVLLPPPAEVVGWSERFQREAQALARLVHPGIVTVHDFGQAEGLAWIVMELVDGADLRQMLDEGRLPQEEALAIVPALCEALQYAHDRGVVHRDIKPENVLFDRFGGVKLVDFGLAKLSGEDGGLQLTRTHQAMGTFRYMAPEQLERPREVDHRADLFSLGVVFYEMLTGHVPAGVVEPPSRTAGVDAVLDDVVLSTLEREPGRRPQSAAEIERDLKGLGEAGAGKSPAVTTEDVPPAPEEPSVGAWTPPTLPGSFDVADLVAVLAIPFSFLAALASQLEGRDSAAGLKAFEEALVRSDPGQMFVGGGSPHMWAITSSLGLLFVPACSILLWAFQRRFTASSGRPPFRVLGQLPVVRVVIVTFTVSVVWALGVVALGGRGHAGSEVFALTALLLSTSFRQRGASSALWSDEQRRIALFVNWALAATVGVLTFTAAFSSGVTNMVESPVLLPPMALLLVASVLLLRAGRLHLATISMGCAAAITLCLRTTLPESQVFVMGLTTAETRTIVGSMLVGMLILSATSAAASAPRR